MQQRKHYGSDLRPLLANDLFALSYAICEYYLNG
jgi:hypothetical protein